MSRNNQIVEIPVYREPRTFEQHRKNMLTSLGNDSSSIVPFRDDWHREVSNWINTVWNNWDDAMRRLRSNMFSLFPLDSLGLHRWDAFWADPFLAINQMERQIQDIRNRMGINYEPLVRVSNDFLQNAYEIGEDGKLKFKVHFDLREFAPEDVEVNATDDCLTVHAKKVIQTGTSKSSREFCRMIQLPQSLDQDRMNCRLTNDGVLMLEAPVKSADYQSITFNKDGQLGIRPQKINSVRISSQPIKPLELRGKYGPLIIDDGPNRKRLHLEVPLDPIYNPEDLCVSIGSNKIFISGRNQKVCNIPSGSGSSSTEFNHSYKIPEGVDPLLVKAQVIRNTLVLEAPLYQKHVTIQPSILYKK